MEVSWGAWRVALRRERHTQFRRAPSQLQIENLKSSETTLRRGSWRVPGTYPNSIRFALADVRYPGPGASDVLAVQRHFRVELDGTGLRVLGSLDRVHVSV